MFPIVNKYQEKTKPNNELLLTKMCVWHAKSDTAYSLLLNCSVAWDDMLIYENLHGH